MEAGMRYFYEAASQGSMRLASEKLGVAVSSISRQISQLEAELGMPLIERGRRSVKLTEAGRIAYEFHRTNMVEQDNFRSQIHSLRGVKTGSIEIAVGEGFLGSAFFQTINAFHTANRGLRIETHVATTSEIVRMIQDDEAHFGLVLQINPEPKIRIRASANQDVLVLTHPTHPLTRKKQVTIADLAEHDLCLPPRGFRIRQILAQAEAAANIFLEPAITTNSIVMMRDLAAEGKVATVLPRIAVFGELADGRLAGIPFVDGVIEASSIHLISRLGRQLHGAPAKLMTVFEAKMRRWGG
jgi:DNA-binding transcriptional LysR family regulator